MRVDLHLHSCFSSDGSIDPEDLALHFGPGDLGSLTDHETLAGTERFVDAMRRRSAEAIVGMECFLAAGDGHLLVYSREIAPDLRTFVEDRRRVEVQANRETVEVLRTWFADLPAPDEILRRHPHPEGLIGVPALLTELSPFVSTRGDALAKVRAAQRQVPGRPLPLEAASLLERCRGWHALPVLAHPLRARMSGDVVPSFSNVEERVARLLALGLRGIEVDGWEVSPAERSTLLELAARHGLVPTAGSDYHDARKGGEPGSFSLDIGPFLDALDLV